jgi:ribosomal protein L11
MPLEFKVASAESVTVKLSAAKVLKEAAKAAKAANKPKRESKYVNRENLIDATFGSSLFEDFYRKENAIVVTFREFTKDLIKISRCGRFGIKHFDGDADTIERWELYHYNPAITWDLSLEYEATIPSIVASFKFNCEVKEGEHKAHRLECKAACSIMEDKVIEIARIDFIEKGNASLIENADEIFSKLSNLDLESKEKIKIKEEIKEEILSEVETNGPISEFSNSNAKLLLSEELFNSNGSETQTENKQVSPEEGEAEDNISKKNKESGEGEFNGKSVGKAKSIWEGIK